MALKTSPAVRAATHRALEARERLITSYPQWTSWRRQAQACKAEVMAHLPDYLQLLTQRVKAWGGQVIWARDAATARNHLLAVAKRHGVTKVVKSKSMTTEEIHLNPSLQAAGLQVVETDLGEFIVQLAGEAPAHLTAPALHLDRYQIAHLLQEHLGVTCAPDPQRLSRIAADHLRRVYGEADLGITGVNFAAAEDGVLIFLENEGNLGQTSSCPPVQVALMGLDKLIPGLAEAEVCLRLLPASATGQRLTALVHFLKGIKRGRQGEQAFYLIILDNGRSRLAASPEWREALYCLRCGACLNICPVFQVGGGHLYHRVYPGAIGILLAPFLAPVGDLADLCTQCGACEDICPVGINLPDKILALRRGSRRWWPWQMLSWGAGNILGRPRVYRALEFVRGQRPFKSAAARLAGVSPETLPSQSFYRWQSLRPGHLRNQKVESSLGLEHRKTTVKGEVGAKRLDIKAPGEPTAGSADGGTSTVEVLRERLLAVGGVLHQVAGPDELARLLGIRGTSPMWLEDHHWLRAAGGKLQEQGVAVQFADEGGEIRKETVVTVGLGAIPELGTVLTAGGTGPASWLPFRAWRHLVVVPADQAQLTLAAALKQTLEAQAPLITWLTGPTRTADIEKVLVLGAQGPAELEVIIYRPS